MTTGTAEARTRHWVLALTAAAQFVLQLDLAIVNVALPTVQADLGFTAVGLQWIVTGYALTFGSLLLLGGRVGDLVGPRHTLTWGLALFGFASLTGGLAPTPGALVGSRLVQGAGAALVAPAALALLTHAHPQPGERARAMGVFQGAVAAGALAGILAGGLITAYAGWRWVLLINPPIIAGLLAASRRHIPATPHRAGTRLDLPGALLGTATIAALILAISQGQRHGFAAPTVTGTLAATALLGGALVVTERHAAHPLVPAELLRGHRGVNLVAVLVLGAVLAGYVYFTSLYLQRVLGLSPATAGLALAPATAIVLLTSTQVSHRLLPRIDTTAQLSVAFALICAGQLWLSRAGADSSYLADILGPLLTTSAGIGLALPAAALAVTQEAAPQHNGIAAALFAAGQQIGSAVGLAVLAAIAASATDHTGAPVTGYRLAFLTAAALVGLTGCALATRIRRRSRPTARVRPAAAQASNAGGIAGPPSHRQHNPTAREGATQQRRRTQA